MLKHKLYFNINPRTSSKTWKKNPWSYCQNPVGFIVIIIFILFNCITNEKSSCNEKIRLSENSIDGCRRIILANIYFVNSEQREKNKDIKITDTDLSPKAFIANPFFPAVLYRCLNGIKKQKECDGKSRFIPTTDPKG